MMRPVGIEARKAYDRRVENGFFDRYLRGEQVLDIGYRGGDPDAVPITDHAIGVDLDYPGYDGTRLPFADASQDAVFASHCLEHIVDSRASLADWYRVLKTGGHLLVFVPHKYLYERRSTPPSAMNPDHKRFYTPASLLAEVEAALPVNGFRIRHLVDNDEGYDYSLPVDLHPVGCYEIELVLEKIERPPHSDRFELSSVRRTALASFERYIKDLILVLHRTAAESVTDLMPLRTIDYFPPFAALKAAFADRDGDFRLAPLTVPELMRVLRLLLPAVRVDADWYLRTYPDVGAAVTVGTAASAEQHFVDFGYFEGRMPNDSAGPGGRI